MSTQSVSAAELLRRLITVTDPELAKLTPEALLDELLSRIQEVLEVDAIGVLLLDPSRRWFLPAASRGFTTSGEPATRMPVGQGFAGLVASSLEPVALEDVGVIATADTLLSGESVRSVLGVPLLTSGVFIGVLQVGSIESRAFTPDEATLLEHAGERVALALDAGRRRDERSAARTLQQSLLPSRLPVVEGLSFATRFVAAEDFGVGGDWFDVFALPDGRTGVVIGDVAGSGLGSAVVMARLRSALRAYAFESDGPAEALARVERKFDHFEPNEMATVLYMTIAADLRTATFCCKGHLPPLVARPGKDPLFVDCAPAPPIGAHIVAEHVDVEIDLSPGTTVGLYTDGLVERRGEVIDEGLERLRRVFFAGDPNAVCASVVTELLGSETVADDTALLVFQRPADASPTPPR